MPATKILSIGLGGVGVIAAYTLQNFNLDVEITAIIRSDYDIVTTQGYTISSCDYGGISTETAEGKHEPENDIKGFKPHNVVKSIEEAAKYGPFEYIVVSTKVVPSDNPRDNIWEQVYENPQLIRDDGESSVVLLQNGIGIEKFWSKLKDKVTFISGVSYISSINSNGTIEHLNRDKLKVGLFFPDQKANFAKVERFYQLYKNEKNICDIDENVRLSRWKKLLYNATFNTVCCLTNLDVGHVFYLGTTNDVIKPLMQEVKMVANKDLATNYNSDEFVTDIDIDYIFTDTEKYNVKNHYQPSMLVDLRLDRAIELEAILGNVVNIYRETTNSSAEQLKSTIPYLTLLNYFLTMVQYRIKLGKQSSS